jgi:hypothetical protein
MISFQDVDKFSWSQIRDLKQLTGPAPFSIHAPLNLPDSEHLVFCDAALNAYTLPVLPNISNQSKKDHETIMNLRILLVSFAFGEAPFVPDFRLSRLRRHDGKYPQVNAQYFAHDIHYELDYCMAPDKLLWVRCRATNSKDEKCTVNIRCKAGYPVERKIFDYHYVEFRWDSSHYSYEAERIRCRDQVLSGPRGDFGRVYPGGFNFDFEDSFTYTAENYNTDFTCETPYYVQPAMQIRKGLDFLRFSAGLEPGETREFTLAFQTETGPLPGPNAAYEQAAQDALHIWRNQLDRHSKFDFGDPKMNDIFNTLQFCNTQLLLNKHNILQPCQGGSSERFYVWVWEAMEMLRPILRLGYFAEVRRVVEFFFMLQDGGCPPIGEFSSLEGAIGTTGPRWTNATGSALLLASLYLKHSGDRDFQERYLAPMLRAARWIIGEIRATRKPMPDGSRSRFHGLMPKACASDGDFGYMIAFTDSWTCRGLGEFAALLSLLQHPEAGRITAEFDLYRQDIDAAIELIRREDGFIDRKMSDEGKLARKFKIITGAFHFHYCGLISPRDERMRTLAAYQEEHEFNGFFCSPMDEDVMYVSIAEVGMSHFYMQNCEWKKAWCAAATLLRLGMSHDLYLTQERYSLTNPAYTPWQPNASGNGRQLELFMNTLYYEISPGEILLFGGVAPFEFLNRTRFGIAGFHTNFGIFDMDCRNGRLALEWSKELPAETILQFPEYFELEFARMVKSLGNGRFILASPIQKLTAGIQVNPASCFS